MFRERKAGMVDVADVTEMIVRYLKMTPRLLTWGKMRKHYVNGNICKCRFGTNKKNLGFMTSKL